MFSFDVKRFFANTCSCTATNMVAIAVIAIVAAVDIIFVVNIVAVVAAVTFAIIIAFKCCWFTMLL